MKTSALGSRETWCDELGVGVVFICNIREVLEYGSLMGVFYKVDGLEFRRSEPLDP